MKQKQFSSNGERIKILKVVNIFHYFLMISPWRMVRPFVGTNLNFPYHSRLCAKFGWYSQIVLKIFKSRRCIFSLYFAITSHLMRTWPFIGTNLNPLHSRTLCAKFGWYWPTAWFWRRIFFFLKAVNVFSLCRYYLPLKP